MNDNTKSPAAFIPFPVPTAPAPAQFGTDAAQEPAEPVPPRRKGRPPKPKAEPAKKTRKPRSDRQAIRNILRSAIEPAKPGKKPRAIKSKDDVATGMKIDINDFALVSEGLDGDQVAMLAKLILQIVSLPKARRYAVANALRMLWPHS